MKPTFILISSLLLVSCKDDAPISITSRPSMIDGYVLQVNSLHNLPLECKLSIYNDRYNEERENVTFILKPNTTHEIGLMEIGWKFLPGEHGSIKVKNYADVDFEINDNGSIEAD